MTEKVQYECQKCGTVNNAPDLSDGICPVCECVVHVEVVNCTRCKGVHGIKKIVKCDDGTVLELADEGVIREISLGELFT